MLLILGDDRLDLGQFPDLMPQRLGVAASKLPTTPPALSGFDHLNLIAIGTGQQRSLMLDVSRLTALFLLGFFLLHRRFGVWMLAGGRQRGVLRRLAQAGLEFLQLGQQPQDKRPHRRSHLGFDFGRDRKKVGVTHAPCVIEIVRRAKINFAEITTPSREGLLRPAAQCGGEISGGGWPMLSPAIATAQARQQAFQLQSDVQSARRTGNLLPQNLEQEGRQSRALQKIGADLTQMFGPIVIGLNSFETKVLEAIAGVGDPKPGLPPEADILGMFSDNGQPELTGSIELSDGTRITDHGITSLKERQQEARNDRQTVIDWWGIATTLGGLFGA